MVGIGRDQFSIRSGPLAAPPAADPSRFPGRRPRHRRARRRAGAPIHSRPDHRAARHRAARRAPVRRGGAARGALRHLDACTFWTTAAFRNRKRSGSAERGAPRSSCSPTRRARSRRCISATRRSTIACRFRPGAGGRSCRSARARNGASSVPLDMSARRDARAPSRPRPASVRRPSIRRAATIASWGCGSRWSKRRVEAEGPVLAVRPHDLLSEPDHAAEVEPIQTAARLRRLSTL